jgi:hypothetical protein
MAIYKNNHMKKKLEKEKQEWEKACGEKGL